MLRLHALNGNNRQVHCCIFFFNVLYKSKYSINKRYCYNNVLLSLTMFGQPQFLTTKVSIKNIADKCNVFDYQLRDHFLTMTNLYTLQCTCSNHKHNKMPCIVTTEPLCGKCEKPSKLLLRYESLMFHGTELMKKKLTKCCAHIHKPPCQHCLNCQLGIPCIVSSTSGFQCYASTGNYTIPFRNLFVSYSQ